MSPSCILFFCSSEPDSWKSRSPLVCWSFACVEILWHFISLSSSLSFVFHVMVTCPSCFLEMRLDVHPLRSTPELTSTTNHPGNAANISYNQSSQVFKGVSLTLFWQSCWSGGDFRRFPYISQLSYYWNNVPSMHNLNDEIILGNGFRHFSSWPPDSKQKCHGGGACWTQELAGKSPDIIPKNTPHSSLPPSKYLLPTVHSARNHQWGKPCEVSVLITIRHCRILLIWLGWQSWLTCARIPSDQKCQRPTPEEMFGGCHAIQMSTGHAHSSMGSSLRKLLTHSSFLNETNHVYLFQCSGFTSL